MSITTVICVIGAVVLVGVLTYVAYRLGKIDKAKEKTALYDKENM